MYLLFKSVNQAQLGIVQKIGGFMEYTVGYLPDTHVDIVDYRHLNARVIPENVAWAWMFFGAARPMVSVRSGTPQNRRLSVIRSDEPTGEKVKYELTADDVKDTTALMQEYMRLVLDEVYDKRLIQLNVGVSDLELNSWTQQKSEASAYVAGETNLPLLQALATARGITLSAMVDKVNAAVASYNTTITALLANKQAIETDIKACQNIQDCNRLMHMKFGVEMPVLQKTAESIPHSAQYTI